MPCWGNLVKAKKHVLYWGLHISLRLLALMHPPAMRMPMHPLAMRMPGWAWRGNALAPLGHLCVILCSCNMHSIGQSFAPHAVIGPNLMNPDEP